MATRQGRDMFNARCRPWLSRLAAPAVVVVTACLGRFFTDYVLFPPWLDLNPGRRIDYWLLTTPIPAAAPWVTVNRCPECGTEFEAGLVSDAVGAANK